MDCAYHKVSTGRSVEEWRKFGVESWRKETVEQGRRRLKKKKNRNNESLNEEGREEGVLNKSC